MRTKHYFIFTAMFFVSISTVSAFADSAIPNWVKQVGEYWITDQIDDDGFVQVIEYLVQQKIITIPNAESPEGESAASIPSWIKTNSEFWVKGDISDDEFAVGLEWLINNGVVRVSIQQEDAATIESPTSEDTTGLSGEVTIGLILPLTGDLATHGIENHEGSKFGVEEFNKHLESIGASWHLKMISEDSATNPVIALEKLSALNAKGIGIVVGPETSSNIRNIKGYSDSNNMLLISCCSSAPALAIPNDSVFRLVPDDRNQGTAIAKLMQHEGIEVLVPVWRGDTWGDGLSRAATDSFTNRGGQVEEGIRYNPESPEFSASASLLAETVRESVEEHGAGKVAVLFLGFAEVLQFMQSASEHDILDDVRWFGPGANTKEHKLIDDPIGLEFSTNIQFTTVQFAASKNPTYEKVQEHLTETLGTDPNTFVHSSYDVVWIIGLAMLETQSADVSLIKEKIPEIAEKYSGAIGPTKLNEAGDLAQADYEVWGIRGAEWIHLGKYTQSDDSVLLN
ncbi:ABC transporter substrate-binding protein [Nitrosopumilus sp.]|uniref:ABC transporter substrate-binding protein n=1 Tax=Nitrosopumilus sp. TaxID=2024843 RepID=UPI0029313766|nr:ABC transporter substrate-binding protein [Nitrosopumilus sp.]